LPKFGAACGARSGSDPLPAVMARLWRLDCLGSLVVSLGAAVDCGVPGTCLAVFGLEVEVELLRPSLSDGLRRPKYDDESS
jgi:hypothetical protein